MSLDHGSAGALVAESVGLGPSGPGTVVLDIGGETGALIVLASEALDGREIEIRGVAEPWRGVHTAVRARHLDDVIQWAGVFPALESGEYEVRVLAVEGSDTVRVLVPRGGVAETRLVATER